MNNRLIVDGENGHIFFVLSRLNPPLESAAFDCSIPEYNEYLEKEAEPSQNDLIATTWLLLERQSNVLAGYMSLINDAIRISAEEKVLHHLAYPFKTIPAMKIAKLVVSKRLREKFRGIGSYLIYLASAFAAESNMVSVCRFLTVDADIEHDSKVSGFLFNSEMNNKRSKTISMRKDIYKR